jgi:hypothetical protein
VKRREFLKTSLVSTAAALSIPGLSFLPRRARAADGTEPVHFFLLITLPNPSGLDSSYLFDARAPEMTMNSCIQNYRSGPPAVPWVGSNGGATLATEIVKPLEMYRTYFSVLNGVTMSTGFDGHDQNVNFLYTGDPFGGAAFLPMLNSLTSASPLDAIERGRIKATLNNASKSVPLSPQSAAALIKSLKSVPALDPGSPLFSYLSRRLTSIGGSDTGAFSAGTRQFSQAFMQAPALVQQLTRLQIAGPDSDQNYIPMLGQFFKNGIARAAVLTLDTKSALFDTHDPKAAAQQPTTYAALVTTLASIFEAMRTTAFDQTRSLLDVTTFLFSAEFGRSMRQNGKPIHDTGTDHNPYANSILIGGKGIRGGQVLGSSDFTSSDEVLSAAHLALDPNKLRSFGRPFDFASGQVRSDLPSTYNASDYLGFNSVINTIFSLFDVAASNWRSVERNGTTANVIRQLL